MARHAFLGDVNTDRPVPPYPDNSFINGPFGWVPHYHYPLPSTLQKKKGEKNGNIDLSNFGLMGGCAFGVNTISNVGLTGFSLGPRSW